MNGNPRRHVIVALALSALLFIVAGDRWNERVSAFGPIRPTRRGE